MGKTLFCVFLTAIAIFARMTVDDVVRLARAGVSDEIILQQIQSQRSTFDLTADQVIQLKQAHISERVIRAMLASSGSAASAPSRPAPAAAVPVRWALHTDAMGFSVNLPADWEVRADPKAGRIVIRGPQAQQAIIWPMFLARQSLDSRGAGALLRQLARHVSPELQWGAPEVSRGAARALVRGASQGAAVIRWNVLPDGTAVYLFCVTAPAAVYRPSVDVFAEVLKSFQFLPAGDSAGAGKSQTASQPAQWTRWTDPREGAFGVSLPRGWSITGGAVRHSATDVRRSVTVWSPDRQIRITLGDPEIGAFTVPNQMLAMAGLREGMNTSLGDGSTLRIRQFLPAAQFLREYIAGPALRDCTGSSVQSESARPDLAAAAEQEARGHHIAKARITTAGVSFSCSWEGRPARGYYAVVTSFVPSQMGGIWYADPFYGYVALSDRQPEAEAVSRRVFESAQVNADWKRQEQQIAGNAVEQDNIRSQEIQARARRAIAENQQATSNMIVKGYEARSQVYDEISRKRENAILGKVDVVDPTSGKQYKVENYSDYHWMNNQGVIGGTKTDTSPGLDWRQMITLP